MNKSKWFSIKLKALLPIIATLALLLANMPGQRVLAQSGSKSLTILEWAYYDVPDMWIDFQQAHPDVKVNFNFGSSDEDIFAKMKAGSSEDIFHFYTPFLKFYVDAKLAQEIDVKK